MHGRSGIKVFLYPEFCWETGIHQTIAAAVVTGFGQGYVIALGCTVRSRDSQERR